MRRTKFIFPLIILSLEDGFDVVDSEPTEEPWEPIEPNPNAAPAEEPDIEEQDLSQSDWTLASTETVTHDYLTQNGKVARETIRQSVGGTVLSTKTLDFFYDDSGRPFAFNYTPEGSTPNTYYYILNLQGDVVQIIDEGGVLQAEYVYSPWGEVISAEGDLAEVNPLRYRGYYYDSETGFYYLRSRYYDPENHRFINADSIDATLSAGDMGCNMYSYCYNSPINQVDEDGRLPQWLKDGFSWLNRHISQPVIAFARNVKEDFDNYDKYNESEEKVLNSHYFSSYKGVPVIRINGNRSGTFGIMFLTRGTNTGPNPEDTVRHEYGHTKQMDELGVIKFALCIAIPSAAEWGEGEYYDKPWEVTADIYGGVQSRQHTQENIARGFAYLHGSKIVGPLIWLAIQ